MPAHTAKIPAWFNYADTLISRLRKRHGLEQSDKDDAPSELEILFQKMEGPQRERFTAPADIPSRYLPARQLLTGLKLAATIRSPDVEQTALVCGAITVIDGIPVEDLPMVRDTLRDTFPSRWLVIDPDLIDGALAKSAQSRFERAIIDSIDKIEPVLILQTHGIALPRCLKVIAPTILPLAPVTRDVVLKFLASGHLSEQITGSGNLRGALPADEDLKRLSTVEIVSSLRAPILHQAVQRLGMMTHRDSHKIGPHLDDMKGPGAALTAARRIITDLIDWKTGKAKWHELSRSILLYGPPGTGKTWLARAMGNSAGLAVVTGSFGEWQAAGHLGDMLREMRSTFAEARQTAPCVLIIDEIDAVGSRSDDDRHASHYRVQVITTFLAEMDQIAQQEGVIVVGTCNEIERMDPAVLRSGRMDLKIEVPLPDADGIHAILRYHLSEDIADLELHALSRRAIGRSPADLDAAIRAARSDARHTKKLLTVGMLEARLDIVRTAENRSRTWRIAVHEAGHAVVGSALGIGSIERMSLVDDAGQILCRTYPHESLLSDIEAMITYSMAGRAAEWQVLGTISAGAGGPATSDLGLATRYAIDIETRYGLGLQGPVWHGNPDAAYQATPALRDRVHQHITRAEDRAKAILKRNLYFVDTLARQLVEKRSLTGPEITRLLDGLSSELADLPTGNAPS